MAKIFKGDVNFGFVINQTGAQPLDSRSVVQSYAELLKSETFGTAIYNGMTVATIDEQKVYMLVDKTKVTSEDGWKEIGAGSGSLAIENFTITAEGKIAEATDENIGQIIYITKGVESYPAGPYIVIANGEVSKLGTTTATGDIAGDVESLKTRVGNVETNKADLTGLTALQTVVSGKVDNTTFVEHTSNAELHVTALDQAKWNNAASASTKNTTDIANLTLVVDTKADASALTEYLKADQAYNDAEVRGLIIAETTARTEAFNTLSGAVDTKVSISDFNTLTGTVETNYNTLNGLITAETTARTEAFNTLSGAVDTKASNDDLTAHTTNGNIHVTTDDKEKWNNAASKVDVILSGTGVEGVIDTFIDFNNWLTEHGNEVSGMQNAITTNANSITSLTKTVSDNYTTLEKLINNEVTARTEAISSLTNIVNTKANQSDLNALTEIVGNDSDKSGIFAKLDTLAGNVENKLTKLATVNGKSFSEDGALVIDSADINLNEGFGKKLVNEEETYRYTTDNTIQYVLKDIDTRIDAINTTIDNVTGGGVIADITEGDGISVDKSSKTTPTVSVNTDNSSVTINSNKEISVKLSTSENNALYVDKNGLFVQAITIDGDDVEGEN